MSKIYAPSHWESIVESVEKMLSCKDPSNGYAEYICTKCGTKKKVPFTCKGRFCTSCGKRYIDAWVDKTVDEIIDVSHRHLVFTIPEELRDIIFKDRSFIKVMMDYASKASLSVPTIKRRWNYGGYGILNMERYIVLAGTVVA